MLQERRFEDSSTIKAAKNIEFKMAIATTIGAASAMAADAIASELNLPDFATEVLNTSIYDVVTGENLETIGINAAIGLGMYGLSSLLGKQSKKAIIKGRIKAKPIDPTTVPFKYLK